MKSFLIIISGCILLAACQKEPSFEDPNSVPGGGSGGTTSPGLLVRTVEVSGSDSNVSVYAYDAAKRIVQMDFTNTQGTSLTYKIQRNSAGIITKAVITSPQLVAAGIDSIPTRYNYNTATGRYTYSRYDLTLGGLPFSDSTAYNYDASGNLTSAISYAATQFTTYQILSKIEYTYVGGNVATQKVYDYDAMTASYTLVETTTNTYDSKVNPMKLGVEGLLLGLPTSFGNNNLLMIDYVDNTDPSNNYTSTNVYMYNSNNKPTGGTKTDNPGNTVFTLRFYYN